jgi:predicted transcriptional regulator
MPTYSSTGPEIRERRKAIGMKVADLATNSGVSLKHLYRIEVGLQCSGATLGQLNAALADAEREHAAKVVQ